MTVMRQHRDESKAATAVSDVQSGRNGEKPCSRPYFLRVGPASVAVIGPVDPAHWPLDAAHHRFVSPVEAPQLTLATRYGKTGVPRGRLAFRAGGVASLYCEGGSWIIRLGEDGSSHPADRVVTLAPSKDLGTLVLDVEQSPELTFAYPLEYPLEDLLFRHLLAERQALLVHACGVAWEGQGYLFVGSSGAGKSTTARLWKAAGATILNDDRVVLDASQGEPRIDPTPWFGEHPEVGGESVPLTAVYLLRKGTRVGFEPIRPAGAVALLLAKSFPPLWDPARLGATLEMLDFVCRRVSCGWLTVPPDPRAVAWVQARR